MDEYWPEDLMDVGKYFSYIFNGQTYNHVTALWKAEENDLAG